MAMLTYQTIPVGILRVNCYLVHAEGAAETLVIDPGDEYDVIATALDAKGLSPVGILLTHAHVDHIRAVGALADRYDVPVWCHAGDRALYADPANALDPWVPAATDLPAITAGDVPGLPGVACTVIHTPGHTPGGVCYYFADDKLLFSGDTLFQGTYGRTDFPGGSAPQLFASIRNKLFTLPDDVRVLPGHMAPTTIGQEKRTLNLEEY